jgi:ATP-dependent exoDNAse (exonuclease V) alpha subunit
MELDLAYAITIHKSQGSEFKAVIIPILSQHFKMLYRNLVYTGLTRAKTLGNSQKIPPANYSAILLKSIYATNIILHIAA